MVKKLDRYDVLLIVGTILYAGWFILVHLEYSSPPFEDAAILMRYSEHLAQGHGIVWNVGDRPVEGATDFFFMVLLAALARVGCTLLAAARILGFIAHLLTVGLVYITARTLSSAGRLAAFISAAYLGLGPGLEYIQTGFGTPVFALFACLTWYFAIKIERGEVTGSAPLIFAYLGLVTALIRPEGALLVLLILIAICWARGPQESRGLITRFVIAFVLPGACYFFWRWHYFGYLLPNPFYVKGGGHLHWSSLGISTHNLFVLCGPFTLAYVLGLCHRETRRRAIFSLIPILGFTGLWILMSDAMNYKMRYQYAVLPIALASWPPLVDSARTALEKFKWQSLHPRTRGLLQILGGTLTLWLLTCVGEAWVDRNSVPEFNYEVALVLSHYAGKGYTLATSEAGVLPLYSEWRAIDTWGLNDPWIAHHGLITAQYLQQQRPEVIIFHASYSPGVVPAPNPHWFSPLAWHLMTLTLKSYAESHDYCLASVYGSARRDAFYYYVRRDFPDSARVIQEIRGMENSWKTAGWPIFDYATPGNEPTR